MLAEGATASPASLPDVQPGLRVGGSDVAVDSSGAGGTASGKTNVVSDTASSRATCASRAPSSSTRAPSADAHRVRHHAHGRGLHVHRRLSRARALRRQPPPARLFSRASEDLGFRRDRSRGPDARGRGRRVVRRRPRAHDARRGRAQGDGGHTSSEWADLRAAHPGQSASRCCSRAGGGSRAFGGSDWPLTTAFVVTGCGPSCPSSARSRRLPPPARARPGRVRPARPHGHGVADTIIIGHVSAAAQAGVAIGNVYGFASARSAWGCSTRSIP